MITNSVAPQNSLGNLTNPCDAALAYAALNWQVFICKAQGKAPATRRGFKDATTDRNFIRAWFHKIPNGNVAIATGIISGLLVLDVDPRSGGTESLERLIETHGPLPPTPTAHTGGDGYHFLFAHPGGHIPCSTSKLAPGLDIKSDGGYIIAAPSIHPSGQPYEWVCAPDTLPLAPPPEWVVTGSISAPKEKQTSVASGGDSIPAGQRNSTLTSLAGVVRARGCTEKELSALLEAVNQRCEPPLNADEVRGIAKSIARYMPREQEKQQEAPHWTDLGNAQLLVDLFGTDVRYCHGLGWMAWDGMRFIPDRHAVVMRKAKETVEFIHKAADEYKAKEIRTAKEGRTESA